MAKVTKRAPKARLLLDRLEERDLMSSGPVVIENFEGGLGAYKTELRYQSAYAVEDYGGDKYLRLQDDYAWINRTDAPVTLQRGDVFDSWVWLSSDASGQADGRLYVGFGADAVDEPGFLSSGRTLSFVIAPNTNQLIMQRNNGYGHTQLGAVSQSFSPDRWYYIAVWWYPDGTVIGGLFENADAASLINYVIASDTTINNGGLAFRSNGADKWIYDVTNYPGLVAGAAPAGLSTGAPILPDVMQQHAQSYNPLKNTTLAAQQLASVLSRYEQGGAEVAGATSINPWRYVNTPGSGKNIQIDLFDDPRVITDGGLPTQAAIVARNRSFNRTTGAFPSTLQSQWGPIVRGLFSGNIPNESPLIQFYIYRRIGGVGTSTRICESETKHFFLATGVDGQHLRPGERDTYSSISENSNQQLFAPQTLMNPVTGRTTKDFFGNRDNDGIITNVPRPQPDRLNNLCRVNISDMNPATQPAGTRWYMGAMVFVVGDMDITDNSAWFELAPTVSAGVLSVVQTGSTFQNIRSLPGIVPAGASPAGVTAPIELERGSDNLVAASLALPGVDNVEVPLTATTTSEDEVPAPVEDYSYLANGTGLITNGSASQGNQTTVVDEVFAQGEELFTDLLA